MGALTVSSPWKSDDFEASGPGNGNGKQWAAVISVIKDEFIPLGNLHENKRAAVAPGLAVEEGRDGIGA